MKTTLTAAICLLGFAAPALAIDGITQAKLIIEHNATDNDTGFQAFVDATGWEKMEIVGPAGAIAEFTPKGSVSGLGMTELFLETVEPENKKIGMVEMMKKMPEGDYEFRATASALGGAAGAMLATAKFSHRIPAGVALLSPAAEAKLAVGDTRFAWKGTGLALDGGTITIIAHQLIVEVDQDPHPRMIGKLGLSMYLPADINSITVPAGFFDAGKDYKWEVLAIAENGNQTLQSGSFSTQ